MICDKKFHNITSGLGALTLGVAAIIAACQSKDVLEKVSQLENKITKIEQQLEKSDQLNKRAIDSNRQALVNSFISSNPEIVESTTPLNVISEKLSSLINEISASSSHSESARFAVPTLKTTLPQKIKDAKSVNEKKGVIFKGMKLIE